MANDRSMISENAARLRALYADSQSAFHEDPHGARHIAAVNVYKQSFDSLAFPGRLQRGRANLKSGLAVELAVCFMEADPLFNNSGYIKEEIIRRLKHATLTPNQRARLGRVVLRSLSGGWQMPRKIARLAPCVDSPAFRKAVEAAAESENDEERIRAQLVLHVLRSTTSRDVAG